MQAVLSGFGQLHYQPKDINDDFSSQIFDFYLDQVDGGRRFLTQEDIAKLEGYRTSIDDQAQAGQFEFFDASVQMLEAALDKTQGYYREMLETPFDYDTNEFIELDGDKKPFAQHDDELKEYWRKYLKYETVERIVNKTKEEEKKGEEEAPKSFEEIEQESRKEVLEFLDDWYGRMRKLKREDRLFTSIPSRIYSTRTPSTISPLIKKTSISASVAGWKALAPLCVLRMIIPKW